MLLTTLPLSQPTAHERQAAYGSQWSDGRRDALCLWRYQLLLRNRRAHKQICFHTLILLCMTDAS